MKLIADVKNLENHKKIYKEYQSNYLICYFRIKLFLEFIALEISWSKIYCSLFNLTKLIDNVTMLTLRTKIKLR